MKISPVAQGSGVLGADIGGASTQRTSPDRLESARAVARGDNPMRQSPSDTYVDPQVARAQANIRKIKMRTQVSTDRYEDTPQNNPNSPDEVQTQSATADTTEQTEGLEETKPLSPQFAALAKQKRALQVKEREILERERALEAKSATDGTGGVQLDRIKQDPLGVLSEAGVSYDQLTEAILNGPSAGDPRVRELEAKLAALEKRTESKFTDQATQAEESALTEILFEAEELSKVGEDFQMIRDRDAYDRVLRRIYSHYKETGRVLDTLTVMNEVENQLLDEDLKRAQHPKVLRKLTPAQEIQQQLQPRGMRTLTNRDTARPQVSRRDRMLAAFNGTLKK